MWSSGSSAATVNNCCVMYFFPFFALRSLSSVVSSKSSTPPSLHLLSASLLSVISSFSAFAPRPSIIFIHACLGCTVWIFLLDPVLRLISLCGRWIYIHDHGFAFWGAAVVEESCPTTTRGYRGNHICVCISWDEPVLQAQDDTLTRMKKRKKKKESYWICVWLAVVFLIILSHMWRRSNAGEPFVVRWWILDAEGAAVEGEQTCCSISRNPCVRIDVS